MPDTHRLPWLVIAVLCMVTAGLVAAALILGGITSVELAVATTVLALR